jgi:hypothetical protein
VWYDAAGMIRGFQICYQAGLDSEQALTWRRGQGFAHDLVDDGENRPDKNQTPVLIPDGRVPWERISAELLLRGVTLEPELRSLILERLAARA